MSTCWLLLPNFVWVSGSHVRMWASNRFAMGSTATKLAETGSNQILYSKKTKQSEIWLIKRKVCYSFFLFLLGCASWERRKCLKLEIWYPEFENLISFRNPVCVNRWSWLAVRYCCLHVNDEISKRTFSHWTLNFETMPIFIILLFIGGRWWSVSRANWLGAVDRHRLHDMF